MKEITPRLSETKKKEASKYIDYIFKNTGIKFKCKSIKDYVFLKMLYLLLLEYEDIDDEFYKPLANHYGEYSHIKDRNYYGYDLQDILKQYLVKYYYNDLTNFAVIWEYYNFLVEDEFEEMLQNGYRVIDKKIDKNIKKTIGLLDNLGVSIMDNEILYELETDPKLKVLWLAKKDRVVCDECRRRNGKLFDVDSFPKRHPNCRCQFKFYLED